MTTEVRALPPVDDAILRRPAPKWSGTPEELQQLRTDLGITRVQFDGVGVAAPQIGRHVQVALIETRGLDVLAVNPRLYAQGDHREEDFEGCLSLPGRLFLVRRYRCVRLETTDEDGEPLVVTARGFLARVIQHEVDHLRGVLVDRVGTEVSG